jgi:hypothetical protein
MTFHVDRTAVNADGDEFEFPTIKQLLEDFEIDSQNMRKRGESWLIQPLFLSPKK